MKNLTPFLLLLLLGACAQTAPAPEPLQPVAPEESVRPGLNDRFLAEDVDVGNFVAMFEGESREIANTFNARFAGDDDEFAPLLRTLRDHRGLAETLDMANTIPMDSLAYKFDIVLRGRRSTLFENRLEGN